MTALFLGRMPSSKRSFLALGFLDCVKARLDPSPFLCPQGLWLWLGDATGIKRAQDDSFIFGKMDTKQQAIVACAWLFGLRKSSARSFSLFMPAGIVVVAWRYNGHKKGSG
jgi:hypothetical protein